MSTDSAHSLSDSLGIPLSGDIKTVMKNLDAIEIEVQYEIESKWAEIHNYIAHFLESQGIEPVTAKELAVLPGMEFMSALFYIEQFYKEGKYDTIIVDTAPTADTIRLLSYPDVINWYFDKLFGILKNLIKVARATVGHVMRTPLPTDKVLDDVKWMKTRLETVKRIMTDPEQTSVRLVLNPEKMVITETMRAYTYLSLYGYTVECIIVNRVFPRELRQRLFQGEARGAEEVYERDRGGVLPSENDDRTDVQQGGHRNGIPGPSCRHDIRRGRPDQNIQ
jgi:arsenite-transporting ATPase